MRFFLLSLLFLSGCTTFKDVRGPDGTIHKLISCHEIEDCYEKAIEVCGQYQIVNTSNHVQGTKESTHSITNLLVKCKG